MTNAELNARAAEIMGWKESLKHRVARDYNWVAYEDPETGMKVCNQEDWSPAENIAQAMLLFHKFGGMDILVSQDGKTFQAREPFSSHRKA